MLMRRVSQKILIVISGLLFTYFYCEYLIYYVVVAQCYWPTSEKLIEGQYLKAFILADTHLLGPFRGHWLDKWRREFQMQQAFQAVIAIHKPDVVFVLGDLFDEGEWTNEQQFRDYVDRFHKLFKLPDEIKMHVVAGNHDIGFHNNIRRYSAKRFVELFQAPSVQHVILKGSQFILINSMALHGDTCELCLDAKRSINRISDSINCTKNVECNQQVNFNNSRPIIMQHFPLYRVSDAVCTEPDAPPLPDRNKNFRIKIDALSKESTKYLIEKLKPRAVFGGHTHHGCKLLHTYKNLNLEFLEYSVPSFSWRNRLDPKFMLVSISPDTYAVNKCGLPRERTIILTAIIMIFGLVIFLSTKRTIGR
ncbi:PREDICTED: metallophosphoesterase 1-like [Papilio polytes]|uniref:metallophosphoesterase 1-like n=1 Tax=Papilio polytes TaxID=76194 RepID=UPI000676829E|nr:PREDICTED: metallophosphoesterase 1-like [Papilio polytes]